MKKVVYAAVSFLFVMFLQGTAFSYVSVDEVWTDTSASAFARKDFKTTDTVYCNISYFSDAATELNLIAFITDVYGSFLKLSSHTYYITAADVDNSLISYYFFLGSDLGPGVYFCNFLLLSPNGVATSPNAFPFEIR